MPCNGGGEAEIVTVFGTTDTRDGWRPSKVSGGCLIDVASGELVARVWPCLTRPASTAGGSGCSTRGPGACLRRCPGRVDRYGGRAAGLHPGPGFLRVSRVCGALESSGELYFGGVPIAADRARLKCGVAIVDLASGQAIGLLEFHTGIEEIFDVRLVPGVRLPFCRGHIRTSISSRRSGWRRHRAG